MLGVPQAWGKGQGESYTLFQTLPMFLNKESVLLFGKTLQKHAKQLIKNNLTGGHLEN